MLGKVEQETRKLTTIEEIAPDVVIPAEEEELLARQMMLLLEQGREQSKRIDEKFKAPEDTKEERLAREKFARMAEEERLAKVQAVRKDAEERMAREKARAEEFDRIKQEAERKAKEEERLAREEVKTEEDEGFKEEEGREEGREEEEERLAGEKASEEKERLQHSEGKAEESQEPLPSAMLTSDAERAGGVPSEEELPELLLRSSDSRQPTFELEAPPPRPGERISSDEELPDLLLTTSDSRQPTFESPQSPEQQRQGSPVSSEAPIMPSEPSVESEALPTFAPPWGNPWPQGEEPPEPQFAATPWYAARSPILLDEEEESSADDEFELR